jgi:hypothetical protein
MKHKLPKELLFFPDVGKVEIVRTKSKKLRINQAKNGELWVKANEEISIFEIRLQVEMFIEEGRTGDSK